MAAGSGEGGWDPCPRDQRPHRRHSGMVGRFSIMLSRFSEVEIHKSDDSEVGGGSYDTDSTWRCSASHDGGIFAVVGFPAPEGATLYSGSYHKLLAMSITNYWSGRIRPEAHKILLWIAQPLPWKIILPVSKVKYKLASLSMSFIVDVASQYARLCSLSLMSWPMKSSLGIVAIIEGIHSYTPLVLQSSEVQTGSLTNSNLLVQPIPASLVRNRNEWPISTTLEADAHTGSLLTDGLNVSQFDVPLHPQFFGSDEHDSIVRQHHQHVFAFELKMSDIVLVEILAIVGSLEPKLPKRFSLGIWSDDAVHADEARQTDTIEAFSIEDGCRVSHTFGNVGS